MLRSTHVTVKNYHGEANILDELFSYHTSTDYENELVECIEDDYLILSPTYARGNQANQILIEHYGAKKYRKIAPFVRNKNSRKEVYLNPDNPRCEELKNKFSFVKFVR